MNIYKFLKIGSPLYLCTSIILTPIQGTTPAFIQLLLLSVFFILKPFVFKREIQSFVKLTHLYVLFFLVSQCFVLLSSFKPAFELPVISKIYSSSAFQPVMFTQSIYLIPCVMAFLAFRRLKFQEGITILKIAAVSLSCYGLYQVIFFILFGYSGDFLSNRTFNDGLQSGSAFQTINIAGFTIQRLASLTLEPSVFAYSILPLVIIFWFYKMKIPMIFCSLALLLSTSGTFFIGLIVPLSYLLFELVFKSLFRLKISKSNLISIVIFVITSLIFLLWFSDIVNGVYDFINLKVSGESDSGQIRSGHFYIAFDYWVNDLNIWLKLFGVGFGVVRPTNMLMFLLLDVGLLGLVCYCYIFIKPIILLPNTRIGIGLKLALITHLVMSMASIPEFSILTSWSILGLSYSYMKEFRSGCSGNEEVNN